MIKYICACSDGLLLNNLKYFFFYSNLEVGRPLFPAIWITDSSPRNVFQLRYGMKILQNNPLVLSISGTIWGPFAFWCCYPIKNRNFTLYLDNIMHLSWSSLWSVADISFPEAPTIVQSSARRTVVKPGANVTLFCQWTANPRAEVTWYRGLPIPQGTECCSDPDVHVMPASTIRTRKPRTSHLVLRDFRVEHVDEYTCRVKNNLGVASKTMGVLVQGEFANLPSPWKLFSTNS